MGVGEWDLGIGRWELTQKQTFDRAAARNAIADEARREHARVIDDEQIVAMQILREPRERTVLDRACLAL